jgi:segregation and condensation protein A
MENPIFRLEGVVKSKDGHTDFVGPLALILQLLSKNKIEIQDISVSLILNQYLEYLESLSAMDLDVASEFVAMASHLVYIKTKMLLSGDEEVDELSELISSLEELRRRDSYAQIKAVTDALAYMYRAGSGLLVKPTEYIEPDNAYRYSHQISELAAALRSVVDKEDLSGPAESKPFAYPKPIVYSVTDKASEILSQIKASGTVQIRELIADSRSRSEMVAVFIAVLELCRSGVIFLIGCEDNDLKICCSGPDSVIPEDFTTIDET